MSTDVPRLKNQDQFCGDYTRQGQAKEMGQAEAFPRAVSLEDLLALKRYEKPQDSAWVAFDAAWEKRRLRAILKSQKPWVRWARSLRKRLYLWVPSAALAAASLFTVGQQAWQRLPIVALAAQAGTLPCHSAHTARGQALSAIKAASPAQAFSLSAQGRGVCYVVATLGSQGPNLAEGKYF